MVVSDKANVSCRDEVGCQRSLPDGLGVAWERLEAVARQPKLSSCALVSGGMVFGPLNYKPELVGGLVSSTVETL